MHEMVLENWYFDAPSQFYDDFWAVQELLFESSGLESILCVEFDDYPTLG